MVTSMKLIIIYGPPAAGKLTVASELALRTGFRLFHNHVSIDCVKSVFDFGTPPFLRMIELIRFSTIAEAAREDVSLIHTFVYAYGEDDEHFGRLIDACEDNGGEVHLVQLTCDDDVRKQRITNESRIRIGKLTDPDSIEISKQRYDLLSLYPGRESLSVETTETAPDDVAERIIDYFGLKKLDNHL
jgi:hypothetical protein